MRLTIEKGYLVEAREIEHGGKSYALPLEFQLFNEDGSPATGSFRGQGTHNGGSVVLGDPYRDTTLTEYKVERQATSESWDYYQGFKHALDDRREAKEGKPTKSQSDYYANSARWWEGYRQGWREKRENAKSSKTVRNATGGRGRPIGYRCRACGRMHARRPSRCDGCGR